MKEPELIAVLPYLVTAYAEITDAHVWKSAYIEDPDVMAVFITDAANQDMLKVSVNVPGYKPAKGHFFLKDYSENEGMLRELLQHGIVVSVKRVVPTGWELVHECELVEEWSGELTSA